jgi:hypothetical protein
MMFGSSFFTVILIDDKAELAVNRLNSRPYVNLRLENEPAS